VLLSTAAMPVQKSTAVVAMSVEPMITFRRDCTTSTPFLSSLSCEFQTFSAVLQCHSVWTLEARGDGAYLDHAGDPDAAAGGVDAEGGGEGVAADGAVEPGVVEHGEEQAERDEDEV
jgi:hypothetical protein